MLALATILSNKLRTVLSLLGITIGIFTIISVFTIFSSLKSKIWSSVESLGNNSVFVQKWPWSSGPDYPWWKYINRPVPDLNDLDEIRKKSQVALYSAYAVSMQKVAKYQENSYNDAILIGVSSQYENVMTLDLADGRYFSELENNNGSYVAVIGAEIAEQLFYNQYPLNKEIKILGKRFIVIGVLAKVGETMFNSTDKQILIPVNNLAKLMNLSSDYNDSFIAVKAKNNSSLEELKDELRGILRSAHRLRPITEDNFALNETSMITQNFNSLFGVLSIAGWIIGGFSILVGGFGIVNIMFVSVKERTNQIGIQKAVGAKKYFILLQFLFESVFLSFFGGFLGLLLVFLGTLIVNSYIEFSLHLTIGNIVLGLFVSGIIGVVSGFLPAWTASRLNPVEAIRS